MNVWEFIAMMVFLVLWARIWWLAGYSERSYEDMIEKCNAFLEREPKDEQ